MAIPITCDDATVEIKDHHKSVLFHSEKGVCVMDADFVKWLCLNYTPEQITEWYNK